MKLTVPATVTISEAHNPYVKKLDGEHVVICPQCSDDLGITRKVHVIVAKAKRRFWANHLAYCHRQQPSVDLHAR